MDGTTREPAGRPGAGAITVEVQPGFGELFEALPDPSYLWRGSGAQWALVGYNAAAMAVPYSDISHYLGQGPTDILGPEGAGLRDRLERCRSSRRPITRRQSIDYTVEARRSLRIAFTCLGEDLVMSTTVDETDAVEQLRRDWEAETVLLGELTRALVLAEDVQQARDLLCEAAVALARADLAYLLELDPDELARGRRLLRQTAVAHAAGGSAPPQATRIDLDEGPSLADEAFRSREQRWTQDFWSDPRAQQATARAAGVRGAVVEPVVLGDRVRGVLTVSWRRPLTAAPRQARRLLPLLAGHAAAALDRAELLARLRSDALHDPLTGLPNRRAWEEQLEREVAQAERSGAPVSVALLDVDGLKTINDTEGHAAGDRLLQEAARSWGEGLRRQDVLARLGGDEFGVLLTGTDASTAAEVIGRMMGGAGWLACSSGVAQWRPGEALGDLLHRADTAMYADKEGRRAARAGCAPRQRTGGDHTSRA
ncbi:diguanylate cyclase (GGDEF)-like protein [Kineococcus xinjiangensis]|uniref:Diguanylate cyclase (GGDEF)-like protein n=1 Tax=Kineococcus xinjiangensis TaxID=512762 RepID=A0A2S6IMC3_9ACTN|nr:sensor domain-containing diguanylate cyclase [Kineococcus xinjiangensis]PPK95358.1 diguanylate cyclase (GGDEF)-like protein [Kineococcus xinjiangensis]